MSPLVGWDESNEQFVLRTGYRKSLKISNG